DTSDHYLDPNDPLNDTDRSGNHYSNGESRLTPEYEWNGWEKVYRTKKQYRHRSRAPPDAGPSSSESFQSPDGEVGSTEAQEMDIDSGEAHDSRPTPNLSGEVLTESLPSPETSDHPTALPSEAGGHAVLASSNAPLSPSPTGHLSEVQPTITTPSSLALPGSPSGLPAPVVCGLDPPPSSEAPRPLSPGSAADAPPVALGLPPLARPNPTSPAPPPMPVAPMEDDIFEDASHQLPSQPTSPGPPDLVTELNNLRAVMIAHPVDQPRSPDAGFRMAAFSSPRPTFVERLRAEGLASAQAAPSVRGIRATARQQVTPPSPQPPPYDVWGFRRPLTLSGGDATQSPS
ncbi:hypothetical protein KC19_9G101300, partial [Ceratodon purpureus]